MYHTYGHWLDRLPIKKKDAALKIMKLFSHECVCLLCLNIFNDTFTTQEYLLKTKHISNTGLINTKEVSKKFVALHSKWNY